MAQVGMDLAKLEGVPEALRLACQLLASPEPLQVVKGMQQQLKECSALLFDHSKAVLAAGFAGRIVQLLHPYTFGGSGTSQELAGVNFGKVRCGLHRARRCPPLCCVG